MNDTEEKIPNLPAVGKPIVFKVSRQCREQLELMRRTYAEITGCDKPLTISETIRIAIDVAFKFNATLRRRVERQTKVREKRE